MTRRGKRLVEWLESPASTPPGPNRSVSSEPVQLRALWALHVTGGIREELALRLLERPRNTFAPGQSSFSARIAGPRKPRARCSCDWRGRIPRPWCGFT
jgi:hypothetical protein